MEMIFIPRFWFEYIMIGIAWLPFLTLVIVWNHLLNKSPEKTGRIFVVVIVFLSFFVLGALVTGYAKDIRPGTLVWEIKQGPVKSEYYLLGHGKYHFSNGTEAAIPTNGPDTILINNTQNQLQIDKLVYLRDDNPITTGSPVDWKTEVSSIEMFGHEFKSKIVTYGYTRDDHQTAAKKLRQLISKNESSEKFPSEFFNAWANELTPATYAKAAPYTLATIPEPDYFGIEKKAPPKALTLQSWGGLGIYEIRYWVY